MTLGWAIRFHEGGMEKYIVRGKENQGEVFY